MPSAAWAVPQHQYPGGLIVVDAAPVLAPGDIFKPEMYRPRARGGGGRGAARRVRRGPPVHRGRVEPGHGTGPSRSGGSSRTWRTSSACCSEATRSCSVSSTSVGSHPRRSERAERAHPLSVAASSTGFTASAPLRVERRDGVLHLSGSSTGEPRACWRRRAVGASAPSRSTSPRRPSSTPARTAPSPDREELQARPAPQRPPIVQRVVFALAGEAGLEIEVEEDALSMMVG